MEGQLVSWLTSLASGAVGGNVSGALRKESSLGPILNSILGALGGATGGQLLPMLIDGLKDTGLGGNAGLSGLPQVSLPLGEAQGCPVGISFIGWAGGDEALLDLAVSLGEFREST